MSKATDLADWLHRGYPLTDARKQDIVKELRRLDKENSKLRGKIKKLEADVEFYEPIATVCL